MEELDVNTYTTRLRLHLKLSSNADEGGYKCCSKNSIGDSEGTITVYGKSIVFFKHLPVSICSWQFVSFVKKIVILLTFLHCHIQLPKGWRRKNRLGGGLTTTRRAGLKSRTASMTLTILRWRWQQRTLRWGESHRRPAPVAAEPTITISNHPPRIRCRSFEAVARSHKQLFDHKVITSSLSFPSFL